MDMMEMRFRMMAMLSSVKPPSGYKFIEYAESTYNAYVTLPYGFDDTDIVELKGNLFGTAGEKWVVCPSTWNNNTNRFALLGTSYSRFTFCFGNQGSPNTMLQPEKATDTDTHIAKYSNRTFTLDNSTMDVSSTTFGGTTTNLRLFYGYNSPTLSRVYYFKQKKQNGNSLYILPIKNIDTGTVEMYDVVSNTIMTRSGTLLAPT